VKRLVLTPLARGDLRAIWLYSCENWGPDQADAYTDAIEAACQALAKSRLAGRRVSDRETYRKQVVRSHVLYVRDFPDRIEVIRILHVRQDPDTQLGE
jgi:toxin ParE1/3/4